MLNKKILLTGASGFLGTKLIRALAKVNQENYSLSRRSVQDIPSNTKELILDIADKRQVFKNQQVFNQLDILIHLAAYVPKYKEENNLSESLKTNLLDSISLLNAIDSKTKFIFISTSEVYGIPYRLPLKEEYPLNPLSYYGSSKAAAEIFLRSIALKNKKKLTIFRLTSVYGPGEKIDRVIPNFIKAVLKEERPIICGSGKEKRDYLYIDDAVEYIIRAIRQDKDETYNLASGEVVTINQLLETIQSLCGTNLKPKYKKPNVFLPDYVFDLSKSKRDLGFKARYKLRDGLIKEIKWFRKTQ